MKVVKTYRRKLQICTSIESLYFYLGLSRFHLPNRILCQRSQSRPLLSGRFFFKKKKTQLPVPTKCVLPCLSFPLQILTLFKESTHITAGATWFVIHWREIQKGSSKGSIFYFLYPPPPIPNTVQCFLNTGEDGAWGDFHGKTSSCFFWNYSKQKYVPQGCDVSYKTSRKCKRTLIYPSY